MLPNPFVELWADPVVSLAALAYVLLLAAATVALAGVMWSTVVYLGNAWEFRHVDGKFGPQWEYLPPLGLYLRVAGLLFLGAVEAGLLGGIAFVLTG